MQIEKYQSKVRPTTERSAALMDTSSVTALGQQTMNTGEILSSIGDQMIKAQELQEQTEASTKATAGAQDVIFRAESDPDYKNADKYIQELSRIKDTASKGLTLRASKLSFESEFASLSNSSMMKIKQGARTKMINKGVNDLNLALDQQQDLYVMEGNPVKQAQIQKRMDFLIDAHTQRGYLTPEAGYKMKQSRIETLGVKKFYGDLSAISTPEQADAVINNLREGHYEQNGVTIDPKVKESLYNQAESTKKKLDADTKQAISKTQDQNELQFAVAISRGELKDASKLEEAALNGQISRTYFEQAIKSLTATTTAPAHERAAAFVKLNERYLSLKFDDDGVAAGNDINTIRKFREDVTAEYNAGRLDAADFQKMIEKTTPDYLNAQAPKSGFIKAGMELIRKNAALLFGGGAAAAQITREFLAKSETLEPEEIPGTAAQMVREAEIKADPEKAMLADKENPGATTDKNGVLRRAYQPAPRPQELTVGQEIDVKGKKYTVTGFDKDGEPLVEIVKEQTNAAD